MSVNTRPARADDLPFLQEKINDSDQEKVNLAQCFVFVVEEDGEPIGLIAARVGWLQIEPAFIWGGKTKSAKRRALYKLFSAMRGWIADRALNKSGIHSFWFVTKDEDIATFVQKLGCLEIYKGCRTFGMDV
jgi:hypothetical protein